MLAQYVVCYLVLSNSPSWSSGNDPRSGAAAVNVLRPGGLPKDMVAGLACVSE